METVGALLRGWRLSRRLSQLDLALAADVSPRYVSLVETGRSRPSADMVLRLAAHFLADVDPDLLRAPVNMVRLGLDPRVLASRIVNLAEVRELFRARLSRQLAKTGDPVVGALYDEFFAREGPDGPVPRPHSEVAIPMVFRFRERELRLFSTITTFGTPQDITLDEISIESYYPADAGSAAILRSLADGHGRPGDVSGPAAGFVTGWS